MQVWMCNAGLKAAPHASCTLPLEGVPGIAQCMEDSDQSCAFRHACALPLQTVLMADAAMQPVIVNFEVEYTRQRLADKVASIDAALGGQGGLNSSY